MKASWIARKSTTFEPVAVVLRNAADILRCRIALGYRRETHRRWADAMGDLEDLHDLIPVHPTAADDAWLIDMNKRWVPMRTVVRTLCLLNADDALHNYERKLANGVGDGIVAVVQKAPGALTYLRAAVDKYLAFTREWTGNSAKVLENELDKLADLRVILQAIRMALP